MRDADDALDRPSNVHYDIQFSGTHWVSFRSSSRASVNRLNVTSMFRFINVKWIWSA